MYTRYLKRLLDFLISLIGLTILSPVLIILTITGCVVMRGNPFFIQDRPGKNERIFKLIKFRTMSNAKDQEGNLLPDDMRLSKYGQFLRSTSLDELPELFNILAGQMAIVGPRPLLVKYLPYYSEREHHRHDVRPGLTGYAQAHGRNSISWDEKLEMDLAYIQNISFKSDVKIILDTIRVVLKHEGISQDGQVTMEDFTEYTQHKAANQGKK